MNPKAVVVVSPGGELPRHDERCPESGALHRLSCTKATLATVDTAGDAGAFSAITISTDGRCIRVLIRAAKSV